MTFDPARLTFEGTIRDLRRSVTELTRRPSLSGVTAPYLTPDLLPPPKPPTFLVLAQNQPYRLADGSTFMARILLNWTPVTQDVNGIAMLIAGYEVWMERDGGPRTRVAATTGTSARLDFPSGSLIRLFVRAGTIRNVWSAFSAHIDVNTALDLTPMAAPVAPTLTSKLGSIIISWSGALTNGPPPNKFRTVISQVAVSSTGPWVQAGPPFPSGGTIITGETVGTTRFVRLIARDSLGIDSLPSQSASIVVAGVGAGDIEVGAITLPNLDASISDAITGAQADAAAAATAASAAATSANGKSRVFRQPSEPTGTAHAIADVWFDTDDGNRIYLWSGTAWTAADLGTNALGNNVVTAEKIATAVTTDISNAVTNAATALTSATSAATAASAAQTAANGKNRIFHQAASPSLTGNTLGDIWFDTDDGNRMYEWSGTAWVGNDFGSSAIENASIITAKIADLAVNNAKISALDAAKITTGFLEAGRIAAGSLTANRIAVGDFTNLFDNGNFTRGTDGLLGWNSGVGTVVNDVGADSGKALEIAGTAGFPARYQTRQVTVTPGEQIWLSGKARRSATASTGPGSIRMMFLDAAGTMLASGGNVGVGMNLPTADVWVAVGGFVTAPAGASRANMWVEVSSGSPVGSTVRFADLNGRRRNGGELIVDGAITATKIAAGSIVAGSAILADAAITTAKIGDLAVTSAKISALDAGKITTGLLSADRISARSISTEKLLVANLNNLIEDPNFDLNSPVSWNAATSNVTKSTVTPRSGSHCLRIVSTGAPFEASRHQTAIAVQPGERYFLSGFARMSSGVASEGGLELQMAYGATAGTMTDVDPVAPALTVTTTYGLFSGVYIVPSGVFFIRPVVFMDDPVAGNVYLLDDVFLGRRADASLIVDGAVTAEKLAVNSVTAEKISALSVGADAIQTRAITAEKIAVGAVTANSIAASAITANAIQAGVIEAFHLAAAVGQSLNISSNNSINLLVGNVAANSAALGLVAGTVEQMGTYYQFGNNEATISSPASTYALALSPAGIQIRENNIAVSTWDAGRLLVDSAVISTAIVGNHQIEKSVVGTVVRAL